MVIIVICLLMRKKLSKFKANDKNVNFLNQVCLVSTPNKCRGSRRKNL